MKNILLKIVIFLLNIVYTFIKMLPMQNKIVMISRQSDKINTDFKLLEKELKKESKVVVLCKTLPGGAKAKLKDKFQYGLHMFRQMYHLSTSKVCVLDSYCPSVSILKHKKKLTIVQIWHSVGTMKKFGYTALGKDEGSNVEIAKIMKMHQNYDVVYCAANAYKEHLQKGFNIDSNKIKIFTLPRIDLLNDKNYEKQTINKIYNRYPELEKKNKKNIVYAPTFRKNENTFNAKLQELIDNIDLDKYNLIIKLHPLSKTKCKNSKVIVDNDFSTFDMLFVADKLISDYSCVIYEAGVRNIPLYFYCFDLEEYLKSRGLALDFNELPGYTKKSAVDLTKSLDAKFDMKYQKQFIKKYVENTSECTKKMAKDILSYMK